MDIKISSNTPALVSQVIGSSKISNNDTVTAVSQTVTIETTTSSYLDNSTIIITKIQTDYSDIGILPFPLTTTSSDDSNTLKISSNNLTNNSSSIAEKVPEVKYKYDYITLLLDNTTNTDCQVLKETYMLLAIQNLIDCTKLISENFLDEDLIHSSVHDLFLCKILKDFNAVNSSLLTCEKFLSILIGQTYITYNYACSISAQIANSLNSILSIINVLQNSKYNNLTDYSDNLYSISDSINNMINYLKISNDTIPDFNFFADNFSKIIIFLNSIFNILTDCFSNSNFITLIYYEDKCIKGLSHINSAVSQAYDNLDENCNLIMSNIKSTLSFISSIKNILSLPELFTNMESNIFIGRAFSKSFDEVNTSSDITDINNNTPEFNYIPSESHAQNSKFINDSNLTKADNIENPIIPDNIKSVDSSNTNKSIVKKNIDVLLSFYVCDLKISLSGTIGSEKFSGYIYYPGLHNLNSFGIQDININTSIKIPNNINTFKLSQCLCPVLSVTSAAASSSYRIKAPDSFNADLSMTFTLNEELLFTTVLPIVFAK